MNKTLSLFLTLALTTSLYSCNSNDDADEVSELEGTGIVITDDKDCCSAEEALQVYKFLQTVKIIPELGTEIDGLYNVFAYSADGTFHTGYNDIYFVATKKSTGNYIKDFSVTNITPLMHMIEKDMYHSAPASDGVTIVNEDYSAVKGAWVSFLMNTSESGTWTLSYDLDVLNSVASVDDVTLDVEALSDDEKWLVSFKNNDETYYISLVNPDDWKTGSNDIVAYVSKKSSTITEPYALADETFTIEIEPTMPDMGGHTSPNNEALTKQDDGSYKGVINLTMTGYWNIALTVEDEDGTVVAEDISFDVTI